MSSPRPRVRVQKLPHAADLPLPTGATPSSAGVDLRAAIDAPLVLEPGRRLLVPTGLRVEIPPNWEGQVRPRSGLALRHGVTVLNAPGTIDADYRGEIGVILVHHGDEDFSIERGDRIAQLVFAPAVLPEWVPVDELEESDRGTGGFGSTGRT